MNTKPTFDAILTAVIANRFDSIVREMTNTLLRTGRSAVINSARDFSCAITTGDNRLLSAVEGISVHIFGAQLQSQAMTEAHPDLREGDAFLDNNPYVGNSHAADHTILVPVIVDGEHLFTAVAKAHQADIGNSIPTTYHAAARDVYEEGALIFPVVKIQEDFEDIEDVVRMCRSRIRVPQQWYGDYLAQLGAARIAERRLKELCAKYGTATIKEFIENWMDYSEQRISREIEQLPAARLHNEGRHDPFEPFLPEGLPITVDIDIDPVAKRIVVDLTENIDNVDCGLNLTEATTRAAVFAGIFNSIGKGMPKNSGTFRRIEIRLRDGAAVGRPRFPHSCSVATTNVADRLINCVASAFAQLGAPFGVAEGAIGTGAGVAVVSGSDPRYGGESFVNQLVVNANGGPGSAFADGWTTWGLPVVSGLMYRDSIEIDELKMPLQYSHMRMIPDTGGAGRHRGGLSIDLAYGPKLAPMTVIFPCDGQETPAAGVLGGRDGVHARGYLVDSDGTESRLPSNANVTLVPGQLVRGIDASGGGYGHPFERDSRRVLKDVVDGWVSTAHAREAYGVEIIEIDDTFSIDEAATAVLRSR
jgi:N-methylhydantoinase B